MIRRRIVIDTNVYVSRLLREQSKPGRAVARAWSEAMTLVSEATIEELRIVLGRAKFARYLEQGSVEPFLLQVREVAQLISNPPSIVACRDPKDDMFLEVAVHGRADLIVTGDRDLLDLNTFLGIRILTSAQYLELN